MMSKPPPKEVTSETRHAIDEKAKKEELVEARMKAIRKKNEELMRRQKEIEEDRKNADRYSEMAVKKHPESFPLGVNKEGAAAHGRGRGRGRGLMLQEMRKETLKAKQWEVKRRENIQKEEDERKRRKESSSSVSRFLADDNRIDMSRTSGRNEHSWGGANFNQVVNRVHKEKEGFRPDRGKGNIEMSMSGKERQEYSHWREERMKIDEERKARQKKSGNWSRAWDQRKIWDPRKKMWVYENDDGNHSFQSTRRHDSDNAEDWGSGNRDRRGRGERGSDRQASGHSTGFAQHDDHEVPASEDWGETNGNKSAAQTNIGGMIPTSEEWGETSKSKVAEHIDSGVMLTTEEWGDTDDGRVTQPANVAKMMPTTEELGERSEGKVVQSQVPGSKGDKGPIMTHTHQHESIVSGPSLVEDENKENKEEISGIAKVTSDSSHSDVPKPQREVTPRRQLGSADNHQVDSNTELASTTNVAEAQFSSNKKDSNELGMDIQEHTDVGKGQDKQVGSHSASTVKEKEFQDSDNSDKKVLIENEVNNKQDLPMPDTHSTETGHTSERNRAMRQHTNESEGAVRHKPAAEKAHLPKLITKVDKKVTFDSSEENKPAKETDAEDSAAVTIGDIPPTPDFLKFDHSLEWGDIDVDAEDSEVIEPKW